jgi:hypothetical protein
MAFCGMLGNKTYGTTKVLVLKELAEPFEVDLIPFDRFPAFPLGCAALKVVVDQVLQRRDFCYH